MFCLLFPCLYQKVLFRPPPYTYIVVKNRLGIMLAPYVDILTLFLSFLLFLTYFNAYVVRIGALGHLKTQPMHPNSIIYQNFSTIARSLVIPFDIKTDEQL